MKQIPVIPGIIVLLMALFHLTSSCTRKIQPRSASHKDLETQIDFTDGFDPQTSKSIEEQTKKRLKVLINSESAKRHDTLNILAEKIIATAREYLGVPHCMGGATERCLDCSGLVMLVFGEYGIYLPHSAQGQSKFGTIVREKKELRKGDLVFFHGSYKTSNYITHSGIYTGGNKFIHTSSGNGVTITSMDDSWWKPKFAFGTRILN